MAGPATFAGFVAGTYVDLTAKVGAPTTGSYTATNWGSDSAGTMWYCTTSGINGAAKWVSFGKASTSTNSSGGGGGGTVDQGNPAITANAWPIKITDGTDVALVSAAGALLVDGSATTQPVSGPLTDTQLRATPVPVSSGVVATTATPANVASSATSVTVLASNSSRREAIFYNDSAAVLYLKFGVTASITSFSVVLQPFDTYIEDKYTGRIDGIWASATGAVRVTEVA